MNKPKLERCPVCHEEARIGYARGDYFVICDTGCPTPMCDHASEKGTVEHWNRWVKETERVIAAMRTPSPENKALTVEELREMDGQPVWCEKKGAYVFVSTIIDEPYIQVYYFTNKGFLETVLYYHTKFYRRQPEKGEWTMDKCPKYPHQNMCTLIPCLGAEKCFIGMRNPNKDDEGFKGPKTNADRIRAMSDEELAELLCTADWCESCGQTKQDGTCAAMELEGPLCKHCVAAGLKWLSQPAEEE